MNQPSEANIRHLQITFSVAEFLSIAQRPQYRRVGDFAPSAAGIEYWERLPVYLIARCPFCGSLYEERLDTHYLGGWLPSPFLWDFVYTSREMAENKELGKADEQRSVRCPHFVAVQHFLSLHGVLPTELKGFGNQSEVPFVMPEFLPADIESYAVMHSLPICRIENDQFVPLYLVYLVTYYSTAPHVLWRRRKARAQEYEDGLHFPLMETWRGVESAEAWDLPHWVAKGKLLWLDLDQPDLPLKAGPVEDFPYGNIEGIRKTYRYHKGKLKIDPY
jgi:hypothetical protein